MRFKSIAGSISYIVYLVMLSTAMIIAGSVSAESDANKADPGFTLRSVMGDYGYVVDGLVTNLADNTTIAGATIGRFTADGKGNISNGARTLNSAGNIHQEIFTGNYSVNPNGMGTVTIMVSSLLPDGSSVPATIETAQFVINRPRNELQIVGTGIKGPAGEDLGLRVVLRGIARKQ